MHQTWRIINTPMEATKDAGSALRHDHTYVYIPTKMHYPIYHPLESL